MTDKPKRGGKRTGAGRKRLDGVRAERITLLLDRASIDKARALALDVFGVDEISLGVREAVRRLAD